MTPYNIVKREPGHTPDPPPTEKSTENMPAISKKRKIDQVNGTTRTSEPIVGSVAGSVPGNSLILNGRDKTPRRAYNGVLVLRQMEVDRTESGLVRELQEIGMGIAILPSDMKPYMASHLQKENQYSRLWRLSFQEGDPDTLPGSVPSWSKLAGIRSSARDCFNGCHDEAGWNMEVYHLLLSRIFRASNGDDKGNLDFMACTSARPHESYLSRPATSKMIDFCIFDHKRDDNGTRMELARHTPTLSVNLTDHVPLQLRPIVLGITTAPPSGDLGPTLLQVGNWHRAQWRFLRSVITRQVAYYDSDEAAIRRGVDTALREIPFIPGVIVQGHRWLFVFSTLEPKPDDVDGCAEDDCPTVLSTELEFGSTQTIIKSYQVVAGLRRLARWTNDVYMPWWEYYCCWP